MRVACVRRLGDPDLIASITQVLLPTSSFVALAFFKGALDVAVAEEQALDDPEDLALGTTI